MRLQLALAAVGAIASLGMATSQLRAADDIADLPFGVVMDKCKYECRECTYNGTTGHDIVVGQVNGNSSSHLENCGPGNCDSHKCTEEFPEGEELWFALRDASGTEIVELLRAHPERASFNVERAAVQLTCSQGEIIASLPLTASQLRQFAAASRAPHRAGLE